jgi:predicted amidohydrolase
VIGFPETDPGRDALYDSVSLISNDGRVVACYRKIHLFGEEHRYFAPGDQLTVVPLGDCSAGAMICFDVEFPEVARILALRGAQVLIVSSANMKPFETHQKAYLQTRALENHAFVALVNRVGSEEDVEFFGGSGVCDPFGRFLCHAGDGEQLLFADIDLSLIEQSQAPLSYLSNRRPELYGPLTETGTRAIRGRAPVKKSQ